MRACATFFVTLALGMAGCSEDADAGAPALFEILLGNESASGALHTRAGNVDVILAPGVYAVADADWRMFRVGSAAPSGLEPLAEDGRGASWLEAARASTGAERAQDVGVFGADRENVGYADAPIAPGTAVTFYVTASATARLFLACMFVQSNDTFLASDESGLALDTVRTTAFVDFTSRLALFDAGTETNEPIGEGPHQAPRQAEPGAGVAEHEVIRPAASAEGFPAVASFASLRVRRAR